MSSEKGMISTMQNEYKAFEDMIEKDNKSKRTFNILLAAFNLVIVSIYFLTKEMIILSVMACFDTYILYLSYRMSVDTKLIQSRQYIVLEELVMQCYIKNYNKYEKSHPPYYYMITKDEEGFYHCRKYNLLRFEDMPKKNDTIKILILNTQIDKDRENKLRTTTRIIEGKQFKQEFKKAYNKKHKMLYVPYCYNKRTLDLEEDYC